MRKLEATVLLYQGQWLQAASSLRICQAEAREQKKPEMLLNVNFLLARALLEAASLLPSPPPGLDEAERALIEAMDIRATMGEADTNTWCRSYLVTLDASQGRLEQARNLPAEARAAARGWPFPSVETALLWAVAQLATAEERWTEALPAFELLAETYAQGGMRWIGPAPWSTGPRPTRLAEGQGHPKHGPIPAAGLRNLVPGD